MPIFICPIEKCVFHDGHDCTKNIISVSPRSDDWDVTIECKHQREKPTKCYHCGEMKCNDGSNICLDCMMKEGE